MLFGAELLRRRAPQTDDDDDTRIARQVGWPQAVGVGAAQALALIPGFSRSGATMAGGLLVGLSQQGRGAVRVPARDADHRRGRAAEAARARSGSEGNGVRGQALAGALARR